MNRFTYKVFALLSFLALLSHAPDAHALFLSKAIVIIEKNENFAELTLLNRSNETRLVTFEWRDIHLDNKGKFHRVKEGETVEGYYPASPYLRFSPRRVILKAGQRQRLKIYAKRPSDIQNPEYHSHLYIFEESADEKISAPENEKAIRGKIKISAGLGIPVLLRNGNTRVSFEVTDTYLSTEDGKDFLHIYGTNSSTRSVYPLNTIHCELANGSTIKKDLTTIRLYTEADSFSYKQLIRFPESVVDPKTKKEIPNFSLKSCKKTTLTMSDENDFEYKNKPFKTLPVAYR